MQHSRSRKWTQEFALSSLRMKSSEMTAARNLSVSNHPMETVDSVLPPPAIQTNTFGPNRARHKKSTRISFPVRWTSLMRRIGTTALPSTSSHGDKSAESAGSPPKITDASETNEEVDEIIVDRAWSEETKTSICHSEHRGSPEKVGESHQNMTSLDHESVTVSDGFWSSFRALVLFRWRIWPAILNFFSSRFLDEEYEQHYAQENWFVRKPLALWSSVFLIANWILGCIFAPRPWVLPDRIFFGGITPILSIPVIFMVMFDFPRDRPIFYQIFLGVSTWCWPLYQIAFMFACGFYGSKSYISCGPRDFLGLFYYAAGLQTIGLFGLKQNRFTAMLGSLSFFILSCSLIVPMHVTWIRNMLNFVVYQIFLLYVHYVRENAERRLYDLRHQLKMQYKATQKAQINESRASDSKRRLTSYVFHAQVRVPLNTALLAVQNMEASGTVDKTQEIEFKALEGSLSMMSKVLNDVLDFNRMDSGRFESVSRPYSFHQTMRSLFIPLRLATDARKLELVTSLDPNIDWIARYAAYQAAGESLASIQEHLKTHPDGDGVVIGDETRLRQIITNLTSNACKFTPAGGKLTISTRLLMPLLPPDGESPNGICLGEDSEKRVSLNEDSPCLRPLSSDYLSQHDLSQQITASPLEGIVVRIEVTDTGYGIRPKDMVESKLFSEFNQTEQGRQQGGKGTGLGLALVRQIVKLTGGRLGLRSQVGKGSTFWVELPLGVGAKTLVPHSPGTGGLLTTDPEALQTSECETNESMSNHGAMAVDAALKVPLKPPSATRSSSALHSLMEQGGRVELLLNTHNSTTLMTGMEEPSTITGGLSSHPIQHEAGSPESLEHPPLPERSFSPTAKYSGPSASKTSSFDHHSSLPSPSTRSLVPSPPMDFDPGLEVLVVDDDPLTRTLMKRMLARMGCNVSTAENGELALDMILGCERPSASSDNSACISAISERRPSIGSGNKFAIIFLDNQMPVMSGLDVVEKLRDLGRHDFVVGVTGNALLTDQQEYLEAGADHVLTKPVLERNLRGMLALADERCKRTS